MKKLISLALALLMTAALAAAPAMAEDTIKIGGIAPLTGNYAVYGISVRQGADLCVAKINEAGGIGGRLVEIIWADDAANDAQAQKIYYDDIDRGCVAILGDVLTGQTRVVASCAAEDGIPMVTASATAYDITTDKPTVFRSCFIDDFQGNVMANFAADQGYAKIAILYGADSAYSAGLVAAFEAQAQARGLEIVAKEAASFSDIDFKAQLTNIKNAAPQAVFLPFYGSEAALILTQANEIGLDAIYMGADGIADVVDKIDNKALLTKMTYADHFAFDSDDAAVVQFIADFIAEYGEKPTVAFSATGYDAALVICEAIRAAGSTDAAAITAAIKSISVDGISGKITYDDHNDPIKSAFVMTFDETGDKHFVAKVDP